jgi:peptidoglycan/LPS O-acetylase OafA/YrhL
MDKSTSIYLDAARFLAAMVVFVHHFFALGLISSDMKITFAREAVMIFFVLSGYVIAYVSAEKERTIKHYLLNRFSRLYSVVLPALILTFVLDSIAMYFSPELYDPKTHTQILERSIISLLFLNQIWNLTVMPLSNGPFWSISFEFWYYLIFAAAMYLPSVKQKLIWMSICILIAGPKIIILLPCWLIGVFAYYIAKRRTLVNRSSTLIFMLSLAAMGFVITYGNPMNEMVLNIKSYANEGYFTLFNHAVFMGGQLNFLNDYFFCLLFAINILTAKSFFRSFKESKKLTHVIRYLASHTFSLYLYHVPLLLFFKVMIDHNPNSPLCIMIMLVLVFYSIVILAKYTERKKPFYYLMIDRGINFSSSMLNRLHFK